MNASYGFVLLAAGNASRLGKCKALLPYHDTTLVGHVLREMRHCNLPIIAVTGAYKNLLQDEPEITTAYNEKWTTGMASSIQVGLNALVAIKEIDGVIFTVCDQPAVSARLFQNLIKEKEVSGKNIIASVYADTQGTPVLFGKKYFAQLLELTGEHGAKSLIKAYPEDVATVAFPKGETDIDTPEDYIKLLGV